MPTGLNQGVYPGDPLDADLMHDAPGPGGYIRRESAAHRIDRNWAELLQELRVAQTGVQILFAFLLSISFQPLFEQIDGFDRGVYVFTLAVLAMSTVLFVTPVALHRFTFRRGTKDELVRITNRLAILGVITLMTAITSGLLLVLDRVVNRGFAILACAVFAIGTVTLWVWLTRVTRATPATPASGSGT